MTWLFSNVSSTSFTTQSAPLPPVWTTIPTKTTSTLPDTYDIKPYYSSNESQSVTTTLISPPAGFSISNGVITASASVANLSHSITVRATNASGLSDTSFLWSVVQVDMPSTVFTIKVRSDGTQLLSDSEGIGTIPITEPANFRATDTTVSTITLQWDKTIIDHDSFSLRGRKIGTTTWSTVTLGRDIRTFTASGLAGATSYEYQLAAISGTNSSQWVVTTATTDAPVTSGQTDLSKIFFYDDLQQVPIGASPDTYSAIGHIGPRTVAANDKVYGADTRSMKNFILAESTNENQFGFGYPLPHVFAEGDTAWVRIATYYPNNFDFYTTPEILKFFRFMRREKNDINSSRGAVDFFIFKTGQYLEWYPERSSYPRLTIPVAAPKEQWSVWEFSVKFGRTAGNLGGNGEVRMWLNGAFKYFDDTRATLNQKWNLAGHEYEGEEWVYHYFFLHNYWNSSDPTKPSPTQNQNMWYAQIAMAAKASWRDDTPYMASDSEGRKYIGMAQ